MSEGVTPMSRPDTIPAATLDPALLRKVQWRLIPLLVLLFYINFLDRTNVSFAALTMSADLHLSEAAFGLGAGLFFLGYFVFEIPSNLALHRFGARRWISRIMVTWGIVACAMALTQGEASFYTLRILLGIAEAGFFPGVILYLTYWFPRAYRAKVLALFYLSIPLASSTGGLLSSYLLNHPIGLKSWQFLYIVEGLPAIIVGVIVYFVMTDRPATAKWLSVGERNALTDFIAAEDAVAASHSGLLRSLRSPRVITLAVCYAALNFGIYGVGFFLPTVIKAMNPSGSTLTTALINAIPYAFTAILMVVWNRHSDRTNRPVPHVVIPLLVGAVLMAVFGEAGVGPVLLMVAISFALFGVIGTLPSFWKFTTSTLAGVGAAAAVALVNAVGNLGSFAGPYAVGLLKDATGDYDLGWVIIGLAMLLAAAIISTVASRSRAQRRTPDGTPAEALAVSTTAS
jgi:ACS family tartrate transporter-like MFS transporter